MKPFRLAPAARRDLVEIFAFISQDSREAAARVRHRIRDCCRELAHHLYIGHKRDDLTSRRDVRFWPVYSYLIVYRPDTSPLEVLRVLHGNRDVPHILG